MSVKENYIQFFWLKLKLIDAQCMDKEQGLLFYFLLEFYPIVGPSGNLVEWPQIAVNRFPFPVLAHWFVVNDLLQLWI